MQKFLVFSSLLAFANAGVIPWSPREEAEALRLFRKYCGSSDTAGRDGQLFWYCKSSGDLVSESVTHRVDLQAPPTAPKQIVFIEPATIKYEHKLQIHGESGGQQKTSIYVLPGKADHSLQYEDKRNPNASPEKPSLFFLRNNPDEDRPVNSGGVVPIPVRPAFGTSPNRYGAP